MPQSPTSQNTSKLRLETHPTTGSEAIHLFRIRLAMLLAGFSTFSLLYCTQPNSRRAQSASWEWLLTARTLEGALGGVPAVAMAYLAEEMPSERLGFAMDLYVSGTAFGGMIGRPRRTPARDAGGHADLSRGPPANAYVVFARDNCGCFDHHDRIFHSSCDCERLGWAAGSSRQETCLISLSSRRSKSAGISA